MNEINEFIEFIGKQFVNELIDRNDLNRLEYQRKFMRDINDFCYMYKEEKKKERTNE